MAACKKANPTWSEEQHKAWVDKEMSKADDVKEMAHSNAIRGVEIFAPGTHNGDAYTEADIDDMVAAHAALDFRPAIKIGHTKDSPGAPSYGFVTHLRKAGGKLVADFESMHDSVINAIKDQRYSRISSEVYFNLKRGGKSFRRALKAVALLGADVPAVAGLTPLHKMEFVADGFDSVAACEQVLDVQKQAIIDSLTERAAQLSEQVNTQKEQDAMTIKELQEKKGALEAQLAELKKEGEKADGKKIAKFEQDLAAIGTQISAAIDDASGKDEENQRLKAQVSLLMEKDRAREVSEKVAKCTVKAFHADLEAIYTHAIATPVKVKHFAVADGKRVQSEKPLIDVVDALVAHINGSAKRLFEVVTDGGERRRAEGPSGDSAGLEIDAKVKARISDGKSKDYVGAMEAVLAAEPELAVRYNEEQAAARQAS